jgi:hypothetical protein
MRLAGSPEVYQALVKHLTSDEMPRPAAGHMAAEVLTHGEGVDTSIERFRQAYESFKQQGFSDEAAQHLAVESLEEGESYSGREAGEEQYQSLRG